MNFHFIRMKPNNGYITIIDPKKKPRMMCFKEKKDARTCIEQISAFRSKYGIWPNMDLSDPDTKINSPTKFKKRTPKDIASYMEIESLSIADLQLVSMSANASLMYCYSFDDLRKNNNSLTLSFSGQEIDLEVDDEVYRAKLELLLYYL